MQRSAVPRLMLTAIGEAMSREGDVDAVLAFSEFVLAYGRDAQFRRWFAEIESLLRSAHPSDRAVLGSGDCGGSSSARTRGVSGSAGGDDSAAKA